MSQLSDRERRFMIQGMVDEVLRPTDKVARVFDDLQTPGGFFVTLRDQVFIEDELFELNRLLGGLDLEILDRVTLQAARTVYLVPTNRHHHYKTYQQQTRAIDRGTGRWSNRSRRRDDRD